MKLLPRSSRWLAVALAAATPAVLPAQASAQPGAASSAAFPTTLTLEGVLDYALQNNLDIAQAKERLREQEGLIVEVKALALPNAAVASSYSKNANELSSDRGGTDPSTQNWQVALQVSQTLYAGGGVRAALDAQKAVRAAALLDLQATVQDTILAVKQGFYAVLLARELIEVQEQNVKLLEEQLQTARNRYEAGVSSQFEVLRAEVAVANAQPGLIRARNDYRIAADQLRVLTGYTGPQPTLAPAFQGELVYRPKQVELQDALTQARATRPELKRLEALVDARESAVVAARSGYKPNLALVGGYTWRKDGNSEKVRDSLDGWTVGVQSNWAIFDGRATKGKVMQAKSQLAQAKLTTEQIRLGIEVEVRQALSRLQEADELAAAAEKVTAQAEEALRQADARYAAGTAVQLDVLTARVALTESRLNQLQANYSHQVALATLDRAMGTDGVVAP